MARRLAFLIANQSFRADAGLDPLNGPLNDIAELGKVLGDQERGQFEVHSFADRGRADIMPALEEALNGAERGDMVVLFYAGHGKLDPSGRLCLATADTRASALYSTSIPTAELRNLIGNSRCDSVVLMLDCCYSGAAGREFARGGVADQLALMQEAQGLHVLTASTGTQTARELDSGDGGVVMGRFTRAIVDGVRSGDADYDRDGKVSLGNLREHLKKTMRGQTPQYWAQDASSDPVIAHARPLESPEQRRLRRLGAWYAAGLVPHDRYQALVGAATGQGESRHVAMIQGLLDDLATTPQSLLAAWEGAIRPPQPPPIPPQKPEAVRDRSGVGEGQGPGATGSGAAQPPLGAKRDSLQLESLLMGGGVLGIVLGLFGGSEGLMQLSLLAVVVGAGVFAWRMARRFL